MCHPQNHACQFLTPGSYALLHPRPPFLSTRPVCGHYLVPLGGLHSVKGKGLVVPTLGVAHKIQKLDMRKFLSGKVHCAPHFSVHSTAHSHKNKAPNMWMPSLSRAEQFGSSSMSYHLTCGRAKVTLNPQLGLCLEEILPVPCPRGMTG